MRLHSILAAWNRRGQNPDTVPLRQMIPLSLKNKVSGAGRKSLEDKCLFEMSLLFRCWEDSNFNDKICSQYMKKLQDCYLNYLKKSSIRKDQHKVDVPTPNSQNMSPKQITYLLRMYPTV